MFNYICHALFFCDILIRYSEIKYKLKNYNHVRCKSLEHRNMREKEREVSEIKINIIAIEKACYYVEETYYFFKTVKVIICV